jgi:hypothetical protein
MRGHSLVKEVYEEIEPSPESFVDDAVASDASEKVDGAS